MRTLLNPLALMSANVEATTGGLFHEPSVGIASSVFPKFHPGFSAANAADAVIGVKGVVHQGVAAEEATATHQARRLNTPKCMMKEWMRRWDERPDRNRTMHQSYGKVYKEDLAIWLFLPFPFAREDPPD